jgi:hypothetical protein
MSTGVVFKAVICAVAAMVAIAIGFSVGILERKPFDLAAVLRLLGTYGVLALVVERTLEVFISAWRGQVTGQLFSAVESAWRRLEAAPHSFGLQQAAAETVSALADYRGTTQRIALHAGVVLGLLIAATGIRTLDLFVAMPADVAPLLLYTLLDLVLTAGMIGGGSDAVHKLMSAVTGFLDATRNAAQRSAAQDGTAPLTPSSPEIPRLSPGPPRT